MNRPHLHTKLSCGLHRFHPPTPFRSTLVWVSPRRSTGFIAHAMKPLVACVQGHRQMRFCRKTTRTFAGGYFIERHPLFT